VFDSLINLSRRNKKLVMLFVDSVLTVLVLLGSFSIRLDYLFLPDGNLIWVVMGAPIIAIPVFVRFGLSFGALGELGVLLRGALGASLGLLAALRVAVTKRDGDGNVSGVQASLGGLEEPS